MLERAVTKEIVKSQGNFEVQKTSYTQASLSYI